MIAILKLSPVFVMAGLMISGMDALLAAPIATIYAAIIAIVTEKMNFNNLLDAAVENVKEMQLVFLSLCWHMQWQNVSCPQVLEHQLLFWHLN